LRVLLPQRQQSLSVCVIAHDGLAVVAALDDVVRVSGNGQAGLAGHVGTPKRKRQFNWDLTPINELKSVERRCPHSGIQAPFFVLKKCFGFLKIKFNKFKELFILHT
jgi:hypothetical protein